jgi:hypothetical protein
MVANMDMKEFRLNEIIKMNKENKGKLFKNIKNGDIYEIINIGYDATNNREGNTVVIYNKLKNPKDAPFIRDLSEFLLKFTMV